MDVHISDRLTRESHIIKAAQRRFGIYGIEKTSMREIANDLKLSKAALYYYFPDKESLYKAVISKEQDEFIRSLTGKTTEISDPEQFLKEYVEIRLQYFKKLINLSRIRFEAFSDLRPVLKDIVLSFREREKEIIINAFESGIQKGIFKISDTDQTASLFLDLLKGLRVSVVNDKSSLFIDQEEFDKLLYNTLSFTEIFINGIK
jgi:AcrR family transcriptional regulator